MCVTSLAYHGLIATLVVLFLLLLVLAVVAGVGFKRARMIGMKNQLADAGSLSSTAYLTESGHNQFSARAVSPQVGPPASLTPVLPAGPIPCGSAPAAEIPTSRQSLRRGFRLPAGQASLPGPQRANLHGSLAV